MLNESAAIWACKTLSQFKKPRENDFLQGYKKMMLNIIICGTAVVLDFVKSWIVVKTAMADEGLYTAIGSLFSRFSELLSKNKTAQAVRKNLITSNVNAFSDFLGMPLKKSEDVLYYKSKFYIPKTLRTEIIARHHDDLLTGLFGIEKTQKLLI